MSIGGYIMKICNVENCNNEQKIRGYCTYHYKKFHKEGALEIIQPHETHGMHGTPEYRSWNQMIQRCYNEKSFGYHRYGGRGITVWNRWLYSFSAFYEDMGKKPFVGAEIDRIDNDGNYEPNNCRWLSHKDNTRNSTLTPFTEEIVEDIRQTYKNGLMTQRQIAKKYNVCRNSINRIINYKRWA